MIYSGTEPVRDIVMTSTFVLHRFFCGQLITRDAVDAIADQLDDEDIKSLAAMFFDNLGASHPQRVQPYEDKFFTIMNADSNYSAQASNVLAKLATDEV